MLWIMGSCVKNVFLLKGFYIKCAKWCSSRTTHDTCGYAARTTLPTSVRLARGRAVRAVRRECEVLDELRTLCCNTHVGRTVLCVLQKCSRAALAGETCEVGFNNPTRSFAETSEAEEF